MNDLLESSDPSYPLMTSDNYFKVWEGARLADARPPGATLDPVSPPPALRPLQAPGRNLGRGGAHPAHWANL